MNAVFESRRRPACRIPLGDRLDPGAAAQRKHDVAFVDRLGGLLDEDVVALPFDRQLLDLEGEVLAAGRRCAAPRR